MKDSFHDKWKFSYHGRSGMKSLFLPKPDKNRIIEKLNFTILKECMRIKVIFFFLNILKPTLVMDVCNGCRCKLFKRFNSNCINSNKRESNGNEKNENVHCSGFFLKPVCFPQVDKFVS